MMHLWTERNLSQNSYQPFLKAVDTDHISKDDFGLRLTYDDGSYVICENSAFVTYKSETDEEISKIDICQDDEGTDLEDRIKKYKKSHAWCKLFSKVFGLYVFFMKKMSYPNKPVASITEDLFNVSTYVNGLCSFISVSVAYDDFGSGSAEQI